MSRIFSPFHVRGMALKNRIVMAPMLIYAGQDDGKVTDLHLAHYSARALGGVGLVVSEVIAVTPEARISRHDLGLWDDTQIAGLSRLTQMVHACGAKFTLQLAHAGRKSTLDGDLQAPSPIPHSAQARTPRALSVAEIDGIVDAYANATKRALETGCDALEIHAAHGYLIHTFLSPLSNQRNDAYGGSEASRTQLLLDIIAAVRASWPQERPLSVRLSAEDRVPGQAGNRIGDAIALGAQLKAAGVDILSISAGGLAPEFAGEILPGYQVPLAAQMRRELHMPIACNGSITSSELAEYILLSESADLIYLGRELLRHPFWALDAAKTAGIELPLAIPAYTRATSAYTRGH